MVATNKKRKRLPQNCDSLSIIRIRHNYNCSNTITYGGQDAKVVDAVLDWLLVGLLSLKKPSSIAYNSSISLSL